MDFDPNIDDMTAHLALLYDWTQTVYPNALFEVRCIPPNGGGVKMNASPCTADGYEQAAYYAVKHNDHGYNVYITVNPLKPGTKRTATDEDVEIAIHQCVDADGVDDPHDLIADRSQGFEPTFITHTGTIPSRAVKSTGSRANRSPTWLAWRSTQAALAQQFGTDSTVKNPSRVLRLAGTVSYPPPHKQQRGYVTEVTVLERTDNGEVCGKSFAASFVYVEPPKAAPRALTHPPVTDDGSGKLPLCVIEAALAAIPPVMGRGHRNLWLDLSQGCRDAHPDCWPLFDKWQSRSNRYDPDVDSDGWPFTREPSTGSYKSLLGHAKRADPDWWRKHSGEVYDWGCQQAAILNALTTPADAGPTLPLAEGSSNRARFHRYKMSDMRQMTAPNWLIRDLLFQQQIAVAYAPPGSYKSFVAIALCSMLAHGMEWQGRKLKQHRVVYVAGEGFPMFRYRRQAWFKHNGMSEQDDGFEVIQGAVNLTSTEDVLAFIEAMQADCDGLGLVVFDTLNTCIAGQNECDSSVMSLAVANAKLIGRKLKCAVLIIHHPGKDVERGSRGHSSLRGDIDTEWQIIRNGDDRVCKLKVTKQKDGEAGQEFYFAATSVPLGIYDEDNEEIFSLALSPVKLPGE